MTLEYLFNSGHIVDAILAFMAIELMILILVRIYDRTRIQSWDAMANIGAGAALLLALRAALRGSGWQGIAMLLLIALAFHLWQLVLRWAPDSTR